MEYCTKNVARQPKSYPWDLVHKAVLVTSVVEQWGESWFKVRIRRWVEDTGYR